MYVTAGGKLIALWAVLAYVMNKEESKSIVDMGISIRLRSRIKMSKTNNNCAHAFFDYPKQNSQERKRKKREKN